MSAAAVAAGYLGFKGFLSPTHLRDVHADRSRRCPFCAESFASDVYEFHLFIAHKRTEAKA